MPPRRVLHLVGSPTSDFFAELSVLYARDCLASLADPARWTPIVAYVAPDGTWRFPRDLDPLSLADAPAVPLGAAVAHLAAVAPEVALPQMFCHAGMTTYRDLLELLEIPYVGNRPEVMALGAHKARARALVAAAGVRVPDAELLRPGERPALAPPVVVKPVDADNSDGVSLVRDRGALEPALDAAFAHSVEVLVESFVPLGREVRCGVLERGGELLVLPLEEYAVDPVRKPIRDRADKLARDPGGALGLVAKDAAHAWIVGGDDPAGDRVAAAARACHRALGCRHYSLFDFRVDPAGEPWFLEAGLYCSFARTSVVAVMAAAAGIPVEALFAAAVDEVLAVHPGGEQAACPIGR